MSVVVESDVPRHSALGKDLIERADFRDAYRAPLSRSDLGVVEIFFGIFAQRPSWFCHVSRRLQRVARPEPSYYAICMMPIAMRACRRK